MFRVEGSEANLEPNLTAAFNDLYIKSCYNSIFPQYCGNVLQRSINFVENNYSARGELDFMSSAE